MSSFKEKGEGRREVGGKRREVLGCYSCSFCAAGKLAAWGWGSGSDLLERGGSL